MFEVFPIEEGQVMAISYKPDDAPHAGFDFEYKVGAATEADAQFTALLHSALILRRYGVPQPFFKEKEDGP